MEAGSRDILNCRSWALQETRSSCRITELPDVTSLAAPREHSTHRSGGQTRLGEAMQTFSFTLRNLPPAVQLLWSGISNVGRCQHARIMALPDETRVFVGHDYLPQACGHQLQLAVAPRNVYSEGFLLWEW